LAGIGQRQNGRKGGDILSETNPPFEPAVHWVFAEDIDATYNELKSLGSNIVEPLQKMPWG
jgi:uncharacterized glyoxalase superfamily protein PhnB